MSKVQKNIAKPEIQFSKLETKTSPSSKPIAIVGMAAMFPKSPDLKGFWHLIRAGVSGITDIPETHWRAEDYFDSDPKAPDMTYCKRGGFLPKFPFDPTEFSLPPTVLEATDTTQLLGLVVAKAALEDAGYGANRPFERDKTSIILGVTGTLELVVPLGARLGHPVWRKALLESGVSTAVTDEVMARMSDGFVSWQENSFPGLLGNVVAGRIANRLDLHGTNCVVDAACASSLSASHLAMLELAAGKADMVVTGGTDTFNDIFMYMCFSKTPALSASGQIRPFSEASDGTLIGEGLGMLVFKRLEDAERDGDRVYAVIKGIGSASDGNSGAVYAPSSPGQARALNRAYEDAGFGPDTVRLVEAHGTGTKVGDVVEFEGLRTVYAPSSSDKNWCALGSVKSQIGHTKAAAGAASLIKAALALYHKVLPPTLGVEKPNPKLNIQDSPFYLNTSARPWISDTTHPRRAAASSFGFGGSNFHMVLEEAQPQRTEVAWDGSLRMLAFSGHNATVVAAKLAEAASRAAGKELNAQAIIAHESCDILDVTQPARAIIVWSSDEPLEALLREAATKVAEGQTLDGPKIFFRQGSDAGKLVFMFPGQGSQYVEMGRELACIFPEFLDSLEALNRAGRGQKVASKIFPPPSFSEEVKRANEDALTSTDVAQPALGAVNRAMFEILLERYGLRPDFTCGHSYGELCALYAAGVYDADSLNAISLLRGQLMAKGDGGRGAMAAITAPIAKVESLVASLKLDVVVANRNSPMQCVLSGTKEAVKEASAILKDQGLRAIPLQVGAAFHSPLVASAEKPFREGLEKLKFYPGKIPVVANKTADSYPSGADEAKDLLANQLVSQVNWVDQIEKLYASGARTFVEVGPKNVLSKLVGSILKGRPHQVIALDASVGKNGLLDLAKGLAMLGALGYPVQLDRWEMAPAEPRKRKMAVEICGANYRGPHGKNLPPVREANSVVSRSSLKATAVALSDKRPLTVTARIDEKPETSPPQPPTSITKPSPKLEHTPMPTTAQPMSPSPSGTPRADTSRGQQLQPSAPSPQLSPGHPLPSPSRGIPGHPLPSPSRGIPAAPSGWWQEAFQQVQNTLLAVQALQQQTAKTHQKFLEGQETAQKTFQMMVESQRHLMEGLIAGGQAPAAAPMPAAMAPTSPAMAAPTPKAPQASPPAATPAPVSLPKSAPAPQPAVPVAAVSAPGGPQISQALLALVAEKTGYPLEMLNLDMDLEADLGIDSIKRVEILAATQEKLPHLPAVPSDKMGSLRTLKEVVEALNAGAPQGPTPVSAPQSNQVKPKVGPTVADRLLVVVSEKTGYPREMLHLEMDLEADLGIDSIKRVEILAAVEEAVPGLPKIEPDKLGSLRTLGQIVEAFGATAIASPPAAHAASSAAPSAPVSAKLLAVVAEKTGYPQEMLNLSMDLEADLGIDSIKRVEILAAVEEAVPGLPKIDAERLGSLRTLGQIVEAFGASSTAVAAPLSVSAPSAQGGDVSAHLLAVVSDKTGYPLDMLNLTMDLEADLGIDSIKRVEILAAVEERIPGLPKVDGERLGSLRTLAQIVEAFGSVPLAPAVPQPSVATLPQSGGSNLTLTDCLLSVVAEKTGYPKDMLTLEMDLEADLGIDSIKRVEILAGVEERVPGLPKIDGDKMGSLRTLGQIVEAFGSQPQPPRPPVKLPKASVAATPAPGGTSLTDQLLTAVAEKTGYPKDMLNLDMDLEADLGVDSIKRVEILASLEDGSKLPSDQVGSLRTLRQVADALQAVLGPAPAPAVKLNGSHGKPATQLERRELTRKAADQAPTGKISLPAGSKIAIVSDGDPLADALGKLLTKAGFEVGSDPGLAGLAGLFLIGGGKTQEAFLKQAFQATRQAAVGLQQMAQKGNALFVSVARMDGEFGLRQGGSAVGGLTGLPKTAAHEWSGVHCRAFDIDAGWSDAKAAAQVLINEVSQPGPLEIGLSAQNKVVLETPRHELKAGAGILQEGDVVLVTGGARGVTSATAIALAHAMRPTLILLGRSAPPTPEPEWLSELFQDGDIKKALLKHHFGGKATPKEIEAVFRQYMAQREVLHTLQAIQAAGAKVEYRSLDVRNLDLVKAMIADVRAKYGPIRGLIHAAGVLADKRIEEKTDDMFDSVFSTKVQGVNNLLAAHAETGDELKALVFFSSVTARYGRPGQVDYCMANDVLNKLAQSEARKRPKCRVVSLNWGPWEGGMVTDSLKKEFHRLGIGLIPLEDGAQALVNELSVPPGGAVEILYGDGFPEPAPEKPLAAQANAGDGQVVFETTASLADYPCLESHVVGGRPVVPVALQLEWLAHAALHGKIGPRFVGLEDLQIFRPLAVDDTSLAISVVDCGEHYEIRTPGGLHARARVILNGELPVAPAVQDAGPLKSRSYPHTIKEIYADLLFHGPHFQGIRSVKGWSAKGMVAEVSVAPKVGEWIGRPVRTDWVSDPLVVDVALQMGILWGIEALGKPSLPMKVGSYRQYQKRFPKSAMTAQLTVTHSTPSKIVIDVEMVDKDGRLVAALRGAEFTADASLARAFGREPRPVVQRG